MKRKLLLTAWAFALATAASATTYYASPTGTSSTGTSIDAPGKLTTMIGKLKAGDVLYLLDGQYDFSSTLSINRTGNADNYITIAAYDGAKPILDFRKQANESNGVSLKGQYTHLRGITIRYAGKKGIWNQGSHNILELLDVYGCCDSGIQHRDGAYNMVINCDSHENFDYQNNGGNADGFADKQHTNPGNIYIGCRAWGNSDDGWDSFQRVTNGTPTVYINCITYNNGPATFDLTEHPRATGVDASLSCFTGKELKNFSNGGNPNGFKVGGKGTAHNVELYRCLAVGHRAKGFDQNNNAGNMKIINCTSYQNNVNYGFGNNYAYTLTVKNCVSLAPTGGSAAKYHLATSSSGTVTEDHNTWDAGFSVSADDFQSLDVEGLLLAERNADGSLPQTLLLRLKEGSTLIDAGVPYTDFEGQQIADHVSYEGAAPDLGCYEYSETAAIAQLTLDAGVINPHAPCYDLQGRRVATGYRGVVVQAGRKFLAKP